MTEVSSGGAIADHHATAQHRAETAFYSGRTVWEAELHSTDAGNVPTPQFKRGAVQEMYSLGDDIHRRRRHQQRLEKQTVRHANQVAHSKEQG